MAIRSRTGGWVYTSHTTTRGGSISARFDLASVTSEAMKALEFAVRRSDSRSASRSKDREIAVWIGVVRTVRRNTRSSNNDNETGSAGWIKPKRPTSAAAF